MFKHIVNRPYHEALKKLRDKKTRNQSQIATLFGMEDSRVCHLIRNWQQEGLINKKEGQRESEIKISELGLSIINQLEEAENTFRGINKSSKENTPHKDKVDNQTKYKNKKNE